MMLQGLRILVTQADVFMGPALCETLSAHGAEVLSDTQDLTPADAPLRMVQQHGHIDVLLINLAMLAPSTHAAEVGEDEWQAVFNTMVHPLPRLVKAVLPQMQARASGKVLVMGSASALRGMKRASSYSAARGAQLAYVQAIGVELAPLNIQVNAIAQNFVDNPTYFPPRCRPAKTLNSPPICVQAMQIVLSARCFRSAAAGRSADSLLFQNHQIVEKRGFKAFKVLHLRRVTQIGEQYQTPAGNGFDGTQ